jgi:hypothetical protein
MTAEHWISIRVDSHTLERLNELGVRVGGRSRFVRLALALAESVATLADTANAADATDREPAERKLESLRVHILALNPHQNAHDPAVRPGHATTPRLGRAAKEIASG